MAETADLSSGLVTQQSYILSETRKSFIGCSVREKDMNLSIAFSGVPPRMQDPLWHPPRDATLPHSQPLVHSVTKIINTGVLSGARLPPPITTAAAEGHFLLVCQNRECMTCGRKSSLGSSEDADLGLQRGRWVLH